MSDEKVDGASGAGSRNPVSGRERAALLHITTSQGETVVPLIEDELAIGRLAKNEVTIDSEAVDDVHARLVREGNSFRFHQLSERLPTLLDGKPVDDYLLKPDDELEIGANTDHAVTLVYESPRSIVIGDLRATPGTSTEEAGAAGKVWRLDLPANGTLILGRSPDCDLILPALMVSRHHARLDIVDGVPTMSEIGHTSGIYVNGKRHHHQEIAVGDIVRVGPFKIEFGDDTIEYKDDRQSVQLDAHHVSRMIGRKQILDGITFSASPGEVLAIAGTSGAGKSTLLYALTGIIPPTSGRIMVNGADLYERFDALQPLLGYVPQKDILPLTLPVERALHYVARLRLPSDVSREELDERVDDVMRSLDLHDRRDVILGSLSGGQQKRASIAAELIGRPGLFFLDEPTSGLDPGLARRVTQIIRGMAEEHSTVVVISHDVEGIQAADRLVLLASGGKVAYIGPPEEALEYFEVDDFAEVYPKIEAEDSEVWRERFVESEHYKTEVLPLLTHREEEESGEEADDEEHDAPAVVVGRRQSTVSIGRQFSVSVQRYAETMWRDRATLMVLLAQAPIIGLLFVLIAKSTDFAPPPQAAIDVAIDLGIPAAKLAAPLIIMAVVAATWFGAFNASKEIVKELPIFLRDRLSGMRVLPYLLSKVIVLAALCVVQTTILVAILAVRVDMPSSGVLVWGPLEIWISLTLAAFAALGIGLLISASVGNPDRAQSLIPIILIPQMIFIGGPGLGSAGQFISNFTTTRWAGEAIKITAGIPYQEEATSGFASSDLLVHWAALVVMAVVLIALSGVQLWRRRPE